MIIYNWLNTTKSRYYTIEVKNDNANFILNYRWGGCNSNRGGKKSVLATKEEMQGHIAKMLKRRKSRGYELIGIR